MWIIVWRGTGGHEDSFRADDNTFSIRAEAIEYVRRTWHTIFTGHTPDHAAIWNCNGEMSAYVLELGAVRPATEYEADVLSELYDILPHVKPS